MFCRGNKSKSPPWLDIVSYQLPIPIDVLEHHYKHYDKVSHLICIIQASGLLIYFLAFLRFLFSKAAVSARLVVGQVDGLLRDGEQPVEGFLRTVEVEFRLRLK